MTSERPDIRVMTVDDHPLLRAGLRAILEQQADVRVVAEATNGSEAVQLYESASPDVVLMDLRLPVLDGIEATRAIRAFDPNARVVVLTTYMGDADVHRALDAGAAGYLLKDTAGDNLVNAVRIVATGQRFIPPEVASQLAQFAGAPELTPREREVLELAAHGLRNREIADRIGRTEATVKVHIKHVMEKLGVGDRTSAVTVALRRGLVHLP